MLSTAQHRAIDRRVRRSFERFGLGGRVVLWGGHPDRTVPAGGVIDRGREMTRDALVRQETGR